MNLNQKIIDLNDLKDDLEKEYEEKSLKHQEFLKDIISYYCISMTKNHIVGAKKLKVNVSNKTSDILDYTNHLYNLNQENIKLIQHLYQKLNKPAI